ncbi:Ran-binding protein 3 [Orchesella cincta]|uniref:Ran-binding protein 3 n=1 Tax=Orchesella cincta TaxID=48709 RepID=A0A1D2MR15_ORCCI|nr:Ran-binding protein 3 [Orchesella cincta]
MASIVSSVSSSSDSECNKEASEQDSAVSTTSTADKPVEEKLEIKNQQMRNKPEEDEEEDDDSDGGVNSTQPNDDDDKTLQGVNICSPIGKSSLVQSRVLIRPSAFKFGSSSAASTPSFTASTNNFVLRPAKLIPSSSAVKAPTPAPRASSPEHTTPAPQFVPLEKDENSSTEEKIEVPQATSEESNSNPNFVFGSNLSERVNIPEGGVPAPGQKRKIPDEDEEESVKKPSVEEVPLGITGEEHEVNAMQLHCRLFIFDSVNSSWIERGRGLLRLNDSKEEDVSRLIIRSKGSLRVMLNTHVWEGMRVEKAGDKSVRLMAVDLEANSEVDTSANSDSDAAQQTNALRIFLVMTTSISDAYALTAALETRVAKAASRTSTENNT